MVCEKEVLTKVAKIIDADMASFCFGSLSVICTRAEAKKILRILSKDYKVQISKDGSYGFMFDFVCDETQPKRDIFLDINGTGGKW